jgi:prolyl-tRNA editing enzyme YbaK/EbsC (Cys-tRNA(Pro) deacylase)
VSLDPVPWRSAPHLLAPPVLEALTATGWDDVQVAPIDPTDADTAAFCARYDWPLERSANCVVVAARRGERTSLVACVVLATTRTDVNGFVRRRVDARRASFASMDEAVRQTSMEYGGITPIGLPDDWPLLVDAAVLEAGVVVVGSGLRGSKLVLPAARLAELPGAEVCLGLAAAG